ncbi:DUF4831 family protein [Bacteroidales bacterium OttesenSCG-928-I21]|nr:DUF4831 family protein [Bacteroidales bacterium OttesenSCG-928-I21]
MKKNIIILLMLVSVAAYSQINTRMITDSDLQIKENTILYYLPRVTLNVEVVVETEYVVPGPFNKYSETYLSIKQVPTETTVFSEINDINITDISEPDPDACFLVTSKKNDFNIALNNLGIISAYRDFSPIADVKYEETKKNDFKFLNNDIFFTDYSVERNFIGRTDTTYKVIEIDSVFHKIPVYNEVSISKSLEQKAEEAANFIIKIRKERFKLQSAQFDTEYPPADVDKLIKELDELENQYLELFIGKKIKIKNLFSFNYTPRKNNKNEEVIMFHLSNQLGILDNPSPDSKPVKLIIRNLKTTDAIENFYNKQEEIKDKNKGLYYRIPCHSDVSVEYEKLVYATKRVIVPQYGYLNYLPSKMFKNKKLKIIFDEKLGSLKTITNE